MSMVTPNSSILPLTAVTYLIECRSNNWAPKSELLSYLHATTAEEPNNVSRLPTRNLCLWLHQQKGKHPSHNKWMFCLNDVTEVWVRRKWFRSCCHSYYSVFVNRDTGHRWDGTLLQKNWKSNFSAEVSLVLLVRVHVCVCVSAWYVILLAFKKKVGRTDRHTFAEKLEIQFFCKSVSGTVGTCACVCMCECLVCHTAGFQKKGGKDRPAHFRRKIGNPIFLQKCLWYCCYVCMCVYVWVPGMSY
jgi:hypothetical protein